MSIQGEVHEANYPGRLDASRFWFCWHARLAAAQSYPSRPITMIVPFPAGGPTDSLARILAERMKVSLGQPVIIENVGGAGGSIGVSRVARAAPDGYTIGIGQLTLVRVQQRGLQHATTTC